MMQTLNLITFPGAPNLPLFIAMDEGLFEKHQLHVAHTTTPSSIFQFEQFAAGQFDVAGTAFDNVVAYKEHQGAAHLDGPLDVYAFMGASQIALSLVAAPHIKTVAELAGTSVAMDALDTGFAFVLHEMLAHAGLERDAVRLAAVGATPQRFESVKAGEHAATLTIEPFTAMARGAGLNVLDNSTQRFDDYQGGVFATTRRYASQHAPHLEAFVEGYLEGLAVVLDPLQREMCKDTLLRHMPAIKAAMADGILERLADPATGLTPHAGVSSPGIETVLDLRRRYHPLGHAVGDGNRYVHLHSALTYARISDARTGDTSPDDASQ
jgi:ABC-type nitrate/sulfonate/bicarbonate transport system substrate-binding protein